MKKAITILLALVMVLSLVACGSGEKKNDATTENKQVETEAKQGLTSDDCVGTWILEEGAGISLSASTNPDTCQKLIIVKAGEAQGYEEKDGKSFSLLKWEIKDDVLKVWWGGDNAYGYGLSYVFEVDGDKMTSIDGTNIVYRKQ